MRTGFPVIKTGFSLWELTYREFPVRLTGFGFAVYLGISKDDFKITRVPDQNDMKLCPITIWNSYYLYMSWLKCTGG